MSADTRLATYGTLIPGQVNNHQLEGLDGTWSRGTVRGVLHDDGWGAEHGCPGITLDPAAKPVEVWIFSSADLPDHWARLDAFEGADYQRTSAMVETSDGPIEASIYQIRR